MNQAPTHALLEHTASRRLRLAALLLLILALAGCGGAATARLAPGSPNTPAVVASGALGCVSPARPSPAGGCITQDAGTGISLRVTDAYADVTGTIVRLEMTNTVNYPLGIGNDQLALPSGSVLQQANGGYTGGAVSLIVDEPLPAQDFAPRMQLVASAHFMVPMYNGMFPPTLPPAPPWLNELDHLTLRVPFTLSPARTGGYTFQQPPTVEQGIGVQIQSLDYSPPHSAFFGEAGGARIELRFTGLPADLELLAFIRVQSERSIDGATMGDRGPGLIELHIPGMTVSTPVMTLLQSPAWPDNPQEPSVGPTVGAAGTVQFEVAYQGSGTPTGQPASVSISNIQLLTGGIDGVTGSPPKLPTYQITVPLH